MARQTLRKEARTPWQWLAAFVRLGRPQFLVGGFLLHALGILIALHQGVLLNLAAVLWGQVAITSIQLMTHYSNDYFDLAADRANQTPTPWSGGSRVLVDEGLSPHVARNAALVLSLTALLATGILAGVVGTGPLTVPLLLVSLFLAWAYSAPPFQLHSRQLGELTVAILVSGLTPLVGYYLQTGFLSRLPFMAVFPLCCLQFDMILAINFPDADGDALAGKRTLVVAYGEQRARRLHTAVIALAYLSLPFLVLAGLPLLVALAAALSLPLALWHTWRIRHGGWDIPARRNSLAFWSVALLISTLVLELLAFLWLWW